MEKRDVFFYFYGEFIFIFMGCNVFLIEYKYEGFGNDWNLVNISEMIDFL